MEVIAAVGLVALGMIAAAWVMRRRRGRAERKLGRRKKHRIDLFGETGDFGSTHARSRRNAHRLADGKPIDETAREANPQPGKEAD